MWLTPFSFDLKTDVNDARGAGQIFPGPIAFKENYLPNNWIFTNTLQGTVQYELQPIKFRFTGSYNYQENPLRGRLERCSCKHLLVKPRADRKT